MNKDLWKNVFISLLCLSHMGCVKMALKFAPSVVPNLSEAFLEECDPDLAEQSLPASLKLMEGLLKNDPENVQILTALCTGFTGYALLFVEEKDAEAASRFYLRAMAYGFRALGEQSHAEDAVRNRIKSMGEKDLPPLFWTTMAWNSWIRLNLDKPAALGQLPAAQACLERIMEIDAAYFYGSPYILKGSILAAMPSPLGGDKAAARQCFEKALQLSGGKFFLAQFYYARYYAVGVQDKDLFLGLTEEVLAKSSDLKDVCLINMVMKGKIKQLTESVDDFFL